MNKNVVAAIVAAVSTYTQQDEATRLFAAIPSPRPQMSPWRLSGQQELARAGTRWRVTRAKLQ